MIVPRRSQSIDDPKCIDIGDAEGQREPEKPEIRDECPRRAECVGETDSDGDAHPITRISRPTRLPQLGQATVSHPLRVPHSGQVPRRGRERQVEERLRGEIVCDQSHPET